jgi:hypothetical protein
MHQDPNDTWQDYQRPPSRLLWPIKRLGWFLEKYVLWPIGDSFQRFTNAFRYRSPMAYIGATLLVTVTAGAVAAAVYFYNQSEDKDQDPVVASTATPTDTVVPSTPTPTVTPTPTEDTTPNSGNADNTLQGVVPSFNTSGKSKQAEKKSAGGDSQKLPATVVRPAPVPKSPPLKVAHKFATTFTSYEIGGKGAAKQFAATATPELAKELKENPPKLPSTGQVPKASVVNVVAGKKSGDSLDVSVSLMRSGAASELRLELIRKKGKGWLVSEVRG